MDTPRIPLLDTDRAVEVAGEVGVPEPLAELNVFRLLLHRPQLAKATNDLLLSMLFGAALDDRLRELVIMRIGWATGADYEWTQHWPISRETFGCTDDDVLAVRDWRTHDGFGPRERAVLEATDETLADGSASAATVATCRDLLGDDATIDLVMAIGAWRAISQLTRCTKRTIRSIFA